MGTALWSMLGWLSHLAMPLEMQLVMKVVMSLRMLEMTLVVTVAMQGMPLGTLEMLLELLVMR